MVISSRFSKSVRLGSATRDEALTPVTGRDVSTTPRGREKGGGGGRWRNFLSLASNSAKVSNPASAEMPVRRFVRRVIFVLWNFFVPRESTELLTTEPTLRILSVRRPYNLVNSRETSISLSPSFWLPRSLFASWLFHKSFPPREIYSSGAIISNPARADPREIASRNRTWNGFALFRRASLFQVLFLSFEGKNNSFVSFLYRVASFNLSAVSNFILLVWIKKAS